MSAICVRPIENTTECSECGRRIGEPYEWVVTDGPEGEQLSGPFETRGEAKQDAIARRDDEAVLLLRVDGSLHSEIRAESENDERVKANTERPGQTIEGGTASEAVS